MLVIWEFGLSCARCPLAA